MNDETPSLPTDVARALDAIWSGAVADDLESDILEFREDPVHRGTGNPDARAVELLIDASVCFANGGAGDAHVVFGIGDGRPGAEAFTGTERDATELTRRTSTRTRWTGPGRS